MTLSSALQLGDTATDVDINFAVVDGALVGVGAVVIALLWLV